MINSKKGKDLVKDFTTFFSCCESKMYAEKAILIKPDAAADTLYYIREGTVVISKEDEDGEIFNLAYLQTGDFIGEAGLFTAVGTRGVTVTARTDCVTAEISYDDFEQYKKTKFSDCYGELLEVIATQLSRRLLAISRKAGDLAFLDVAARIRIALDELATLPDAKLHAKGIQLKTTRQELGKMVSCSREMAGRIIQQLKNDKILWARGKTIILYDDAHRGLDHDI
jgi:CRP/FNR family cyclic AMP-dependent transcriptional regulator